MRQRLFSKSERKKGFVKTVSLRAFINKPLPDGADSPHFKAFTAIFPFRFRQSEGSKSEGVKSPDSDTEFVGV